MSRNASGSEKVLMSARQAIVSASTMEQLCQVQAVVLPLDYGLSLADTLELLRLFRSIASLSTVAAQFAADS